ncbi:MAG: hypothetical protein AAB482_04625 [Patescibacteria group bacterium]
MAKKKMTIDDLAFMVNKGFDHMSETLADKKSVNKRFDLVDEQFSAVDQRFNLVDKRFTGVEQKLDHMDARLGSVERDVAEIRKHFVYRDEFEDALARLRLVEKKLGIKSGK